MSVPVVAKDSPVPPTRPDGDRFRRSDAVAVACLFTGALALRLFNLQQIWANDPFFNLPSIDSRLYHEWALRIVAGDWLEEQRLRPLARRIELLATRELARLEGQAA